MDIKGLEYDGETTWEEVFNSWKEREGDRPEWHRVAASKGWGDHPGAWEDWRRAWVSNFGARDRKWHRYRISNPQETVPHFLIGPTPGWQNHFPEGERNTHTFAEMVAHPDYIAHASHTKVRAILDDFPDLTELIGVVVPNRELTKGSGIVAIEGHHRAAAIALAAKEGRELKHATPPTIVLTHLNAGEEQVLDVMLARGSHKKDYQ